MVLSSLTRLAHAALSSLPASAAAGSAARTAASAVRNFRPPRLIEEVSLIADFYGVD
jgi:hypothetical protein